MSEKVGQQQLELERLYEDIGVAVGRIEHMIYNGMPGSEVIENPRLRVEQYVRGATGPVLVRSFGYIPMLDTTAGYDALTEEGLGGAIQYMPALTLVDGTEQRTYMLASDSTWYYPPGSETPHTDNPEFTETLFYELQQLLFNMEHSPGYCTVNAQRLRQ